MNFLENILSKLQEGTGRVVLAEANAGGDRSATGSDFLGQIATARAFLRASGLTRGDRCALVAPNSIRWAALDLAIISEGLIAVPMYARQAAVELAAMLRDLRVAEVSKLDMKVEGGKVVAYRARVQLSFKYEA